MGLIKSLGIGRSVRVHMFFFDLPSDANAKDRALYLGLCGDSHELKRAEEHCVPKLVPHLSDQGRSMRLYTQCHTPVRQPS